MFRRRSSRAGLEQTAAVQQRNDREHLGAGADFENREEVRQIVAEHVAGHGDRILAFLHPLQRITAGVRRRHDLDFKTGRLVLRQIGIHLLDQLRVVGAVLVQPEYCGSAGRLRAIHRQLDPILNRRILHLTGAPDIALFDLVLEQRLARRIHDADCAVARRLEGLIVRAVFLCRLSHQSDVGHAAHRSRVERPVLLTELDDFVIDRRVTRVRNHTLDVGQLAVRTPHLAAVPNHRRHGGVDDDVARHMQVGDALVAVHHRHRRPLLIDRLDIRFDRFALIVRQGLDLRIDVAEAVVRVHAELFERLGVLLEHILVKDRNRVSEHDGVGDLHHGGFHVERPEDTLLLGLIDLLLQKLAQGLDAHERRVQHFAGLQRDLVLEHRHLAVRTDELDLRRGRSGNRQRLFVRPEVTALHMGDVGLGIRAPRRHLVRVLAGIGLHGERRAAVRVALAQHRIDRAALHFVVAGLDLLFLVVLRILRIVRQLVALALQFLDRRDQLRDRGADVGQLDDVRFRGLGQLTELGQGIRLFLRRGQVFGKYGKHAARE